MENTITAIATPLGEGSIGIVRISGNQAIAVGQKIFKAKYNHQWAQGAGFKLVYGHIINPQTKEIIDEVLLPLMRRPKSFTGEDIIEINCHGGLLPLRKILELTLNQGAVLAEPGEFSKRAFLNGRLDLAQAESIIDIIKSKTDTGLKIATAQLQGNLSAKIRDIQNDIAGLLAQIEANLDFPEHDLAEISSQQLAGKLKAILSEINELITGAEIGKIYRDGLRTVIIGRPNVGKSSLLNALLKEDRAIVTEVPGTTRDVITEIINRGGIPLKITDTAGLRKTENIVEKMGVERTKELIKQADLILFVLDVVTGWTKEDLEIMKLIKNTKVILILNKIDLHSDKIKAIKSKFTNIPVLEISALHRKGLGDLEQQITALVLGGQVGISAEPLITNIRHKQALEKTKKHLETIIKDNENKIPEDLLAIDIKDSWESLGEITGTTVSEDLIDRIFKDFCIGK